MLSEAAEGEWCAAAETMSHGIVQEQHGDTGGKERYEEGDKEGAAAVLVGDVGEMPDTTKANC